MLTSGRKKTEEFGKVSLDYAMRLAMEREGISVDMEVSAKAMDWGNEWEPYAIAKYEQTYFLKVWGSQIPINHKKYKYVAGTPDGLVGSSGGVDVKCPYKTILHMKNYLYGHQKQEYYSQLQGYLWITNRDWWDLVSYDPRLPEDLQIVRYRVYYDPDYIYNMETRYLKFEQIIENYQKQIRGIRNGK